MAALPSVKTGYKGVTLRGGKYRVSMCVGELSYGVGSFDDLDDAVHAYDGEAISVFGEAAKTNRSHEEYHRIERQRLAGLYRRYPSLDWGEKEWQLAFTCTTALERLLDDMHTAHLHGVIDNPNHLKLQTARDRILNAR